ncbi:MAG: hypothetical protein CBC13_04755 [Planctomycetia bacterium TMED53]|nr:MAG: hypothetical protein CBC13_04755 [Planctomycetia bacterium TMED53]
MFTTPFEGASGSSNGPILVVGWPGLGGVASSCVRNLSGSLHSDSVSALNPDPHFMVDDIQVKNGLCFPGSLPKLVFQKVVTKSSNELILFIPEAQSLDNPLALARSVIRSAVSNFGVETVITFAAISSLLQPEDDPTVWFGSTDYHLGESLAKAGIPPLKEERICGLNGLTLLAAAEMGLRGTCLVSEIPVWGLHSPNPKATKALLKSFCSLLSIRMNFDHLDGQISALEDNMISLRDSFNNYGEESWLAPENTTESYLDENEADDGVKAGSKELEDIEIFFTRARFDRSQTPLLKAELDRLGLFKKYEDRFLDLFRDMS